MQKTGIQWCDMTWNPVVGCSAESEGCERCYAAAWAKRFGWPWGAPRLIVERLGEPLRVKGKKGVRVFCGSMTDLGHPGVEAGWLTKIGLVMEMANAHTYLVLTKRPGPWMRALPRRTWLGVTVETQRWMEPRVLELAAVDEGQAMEGKAMVAGRGVRFISVEPMLGPVRLEGMHPDWVICGPETGPGARECRPEWIKALADECWRDGIPFFDKRKTNPLMQQVPVLDEKGWVGVLEAK